MATKIFSLFTSSLLLSLSSFAQSSTPVPENATLDIKFDQSGKLATPPVGFALIAGKTYGLKVTVSKPEQQQKALWKAVADKCGATLDRLNDPDDTLSLRFQTLYSANDLQDLKRELGAMNSILNSATPLTEFDRSTETFSYFISKAFIREQLFGKIFTITISNNTTTTSYQVDANTDFATAAQTFTCPADSFTLTVRVANLQKQFLKNYFTQARRIEAALFDGIRPRGFYKGDVPALLSLQASFDSLYKVVTAIDKNEIIICSEDIVKRYDELVTAYTTVLGASNVEKVIRSSWLKTWFWVTQGSLKLNPLAFTDANLLPVKEGYDEPNAKVYDDYVRSAINLMSNANTLNETKADYVRMDSLLRQQGKGAEKFSFAAENEQLVQSNASQAKAQQTVEYTVHRVVFKAVPADETNSYLLRTYNAAENLKGSKGNFSTTVSNDTKVTAVVYNVGANQALTLKEMATDIKDQSKIITDLNDAGSVFGGVLTQAATALPLFKNLVTQFDNSRPAPTFDPVVIPKEVPTVGQGAFTLLAPNSKKPVSTYLLRVTQPNKTLKVQFFADTRPLNRSGDLYAAVDSYLVDKKLFFCRPFVDEVHREIKSFLLSSQENFRASNPDVEMDVSDTIVAISKGMALVIERLYNKYSWKRIRDDVAAKRNYLIAAADLIRSPFQATLPPKEFKSEKDDDPLFRNQYEALASEKTAKQKDFELVLTDKKSKAETHFKDTYKTAPTHRIAGSLGVGYIINSFRRSEGTVINGVITNTADEEQVRLFAGLHIYPFSPIIMADDRSVFEMKNWKEFSSRLSLFAGVSFPKPLYNLHPGLSVDIWPGIKLTGGVHFYRYTSYKILNNQIVEQKSRYIYNGAFGALTIEPGTFVKLIGLFN